MNAMVCCCNCALSLSALGIRIIAPIPGRGTIGIEVPNQNPATVSMKAVLSSDKFQNSEMELPFALGKTISNETFVVDLAKMPHLLMAGATGQGKSVGLNAILTSLLYKKHPNLRVRLMIQLTPLHSLLWQTLCLGGLISIDRILPLLKFLVNIRRNRLALEILRIPLNMIYIKQLTKSR